MPSERTLCIVKPDAVEKKKTGAILAILEERGFSLVHKARPFFGELVQFMTRSPIVIAVLERENAVTEYRGVMGATDPAKAEAGTIRKLHGANVGENAVHGSDSLENAKIEIAYFFAASEVAPAAPSSP
jgi:nucleoside-diphosphate kinase